MKNRLSTPALAVSAIAVWVAACGLMTWVHFAYDGAVSVNPVYWWVYGGAILFAGAFTENYAENRRSDRSPRWAHVLLMIVSAALAYLLIDQYGAQLPRMMLYYPLLWWLVLVLLILFGLWAYRNSRFRRPRRPRAARSSFAGSCVFLLTMFAPLLVAALLYLAVFHPVTVDEITPIGEAEGGQFIGRIDGDRTQTPLGLYFFADGDRWYYYDVLTGAPAVYEPSGLAANR